MRHRRPGLGEAIFERFQRRGERLPAHVLLLGERLRGLTVVGNDLLDGRDDVFGANRLERRQGMMLEQRVIRHGHLGRWNRFHPIWGEPAPLSIRSPARVTVQIDPGYPHACSFRVPARIRGAKASARSRLALRQVPDRLFAFSLSSHGIMACRHRPQPSDIGLE